MGVGFVPAGGLGRGRVSFGGFSWLGKGRGLYYSFVPSSLGSRWVGLGEVMAGGFWRFQYWFQA